MSIQRKKRMKFRLLIVLIIAVVLLVAISRP